jgi:hypothetical protein
MTPERMLAEFEALASRLGIAVRVEPFETGLSDRGGGLCRLRGRPLVLMDDSLPLGDRIAVLATALADFDLEGVYVSPLVRARIENARGVQQGEGAIFPSPRTVL